MFKLILLLVVFGYISGLADAQTHFETDNITTSSGDLKITFIGHASLIFTFNGKVIHVDPDGELADYSTLPKADIVLIPTSIVTILIYLLSKYYEPIKPN